MIWRSAEIGLVSDEHNRRLAVDDLPDLGLPAITDVHERARVYDTEANNEHIRRWVGQRSHLGVLGLSSRVPQLHVYLARHKAFRIASTLTTSLLARTLQVLSDPYCQSTCLCVCLSVCLSANLMLNISKTKPRVRVQSGAYGKVPMARRLVTSLIMLRACVMS